MKLPLVRGAVLCLLQTVALFTPVPQAAATDLEAPMVLVATPVLGASGYRETVVLVVPRGDSTHFGFVLNRPTDTPVAALFPEDQASQRVTARVHLGGPVLTNSLFALVRGPIAAAPELLEVTPELFAAIRADAVDHVIADRPGDARFFVGLVAWGPDELAYEVSAGAWDVLPPEADLVLGIDSHGLWKRLTLRARVLQT